MGERDSEGTYENINSITMKILKKSVHVTEICFT